MANDPGPARADAPPVLDGPPMVWFVALRCDIDDALLCGDLNADQFCVLVFLTLQAKVHGDTGSVWTSATHVSAALRGMDYDRAKRALAALERRGFIRRLRESGSRARHPVVIDRYVRFDVHGEMHLVSAATTSDWRRPATVLCTSKRRQGARRPAPPYTEEEPRTEQEERPSDAGGGAAGGASPGSGNEAPSKAGSAADRIADLWAEVCPQLSQPVRPLARGVRQALAGAAHRETGRDWRATFTRVAASAFLSGRKTDFRASVVWVVGPQNLAKLDAGQYDDEPGGLPRVQRPTKADDLHAMAQRSMERFRAREAASAAPPIGGDDGTF